METELEKFDRYNNLAKKCITKRDRLDIQFRDLLDKHCNANGEISAEHYPIISKIEQERDDMNWLALKYLMKDSVLWKGVIC